MIFELFKEVAWFTIGIIFVFVAVALAFNVLYGLIKLTSMLWGV